MKIKLTLIFILLMTPMFAQAHSVTLSWLWSQGTGDIATGFHIQRSLTTGGPYTTVGTVSSPTTLSFIDGNVTAGTTYFYVVTAFNGGGDSTLSNQVTCVIPFQAPTTPTGLSAIVK